KNAHGEYKMRLRELSDYEVNALRDGGLGEQELKAKMEELVKYFDTEEKTNLYEARTNARTKAWEGKLGGKVMEKAGDFVNWYRKQNVWAKSAVGMALTASGLGVAALGMRALGGAATGVGITAAFEARHRMQEKNKTETQRKEFTKQLEGKDAEDKLNALMGKLDAEINSYEGSLQNEKHQALRRRQLGVAVGVFIGSGAMGKLLGGGMHMLAETDTAKSVTQFVASSEIVKTTASFWKEKLNGLFSTTAEKANQLFDMGSSALHQASQGVSETISDAYENVTDKVEGTMVSVKESILGDGSAEVPNAESTSLETASMRRVHMLHGKSDLAHEFAKRMGIDNPDNVDFVTKGGVPVEINGQPVPEELFSEQQRVSVEMAGKISAAMHGAESMGGQPVDSFEMAEKFADKMDIHDLQNIKYSGGIPVEINGVRVPVGLMTDEQLRVVNLFNENTANIAGIDLEVMKGSSLEGTLIKHLTSTGMDAQEAGTKAHQMALAYAKEHHLAGGPQSLIHAGAHIELDAEGKILNISGDDKLGYLHPKVETIKPEMAKKVFDIGDAPASHPAEVPVQAAPAVSEAPIMTPPEAPARPIGYDYYSESDMGASSRATSAASEISRTVSHEAPVGSMENGYGGDLNNSSKAAFATPEVATVVPSEVHPTHSKSLNFEDAPVENSTPESNVASHVAASQEAPLYVEGDYGYENFSQDLDKMVNEMQRAREDIINSYDLKDDFAMDSRMNNLEEKIKAANIGGSGSTLEYSPLTIAEQQELDLLKGFKRSVGVAYGKLVDTFLDIKKDDNLAILDENVNQYLEVNKQSNAAKIFTHLKEVTTPEEMNKYQLNPGQNEKIVDWHKRVIRFMLRKKLDGVAN
ncbi:MAG: hypothetical protein WC823_02445, partial [Parcubacteria group bacterium]